MDSSDFVYKLASWPSISLSAPFLTAKSGSLSEGPGDPWKLGSGVAEPEWLVRSMLVVVVLVTVVGLQGGLGSGAALLLAVELAGRSTGQ